MVKQEHIPTCTVLFTHIDEVITYKSTALSTPNDSMHRLCMHDSLNMLGVLGEPDSTVFKYE